MEASFGAVEETACSTMASLTNEALGAAKETESVARTALLLSIAIVITICSHRGCDDLCGKIFVNVRSLVILSKMPMTPDVRTFINPFIQPW
jgi:hypothetical protein